MIESGSLRTVDLAVVLLSAGVVVGATVRGGRLMADPPRPA